MRPISHPAQWTGEWPAILVAEAGREERRALLRGLAARMLGCPPEEVAVRHEDGRAPSLARPGGGGLFLSSGSRAGVAALAVGRAPLGVDIEAVEPGAEPPWHVLHPQERAFLQTLGVSVCARAFAELWACKEAYLKAIGTGFGREPSGFAVTLGAGGSAKVFDPHGPSGDLLLSTAWVEVAGATFAVALAALGPADRGPGSQEAGIL